MAFKLGTELKDGMGPMRELFWRLMASRSSRGANAATLGRPWRPMLARLMLLTMSLVQTIPIQMLSRSQGEDDSFQLVKESELDKEFLNFKRASEEEFWEREWEESKRKRRRRPTTAMAENGWPFPR